MRNLYNWYISFFALVFALFALEPTVLLSKAETLYLVVPLARFLGLCFLISITCLLVASKISRMTFLVTLSVLLTVTVISLKASFHPVISSLSIEFFLFCSFLYLEHVIQNNLFCFSWYRMFGRITVDFCFVHSIFSILIYSHLRKRYQA